MYLQGCWHPQGWQRPDLSIFVNWLSQDPLGADQLDDLPIEAWGLRLPPGVTGARMCQTRHLAFDSMQVLEVATTARTQRHILSRPLYVWQLACHFSVTSQLVRAQLRWELLISKHKAARVAYVDYLDKVQESARPSCKDFSRPYLAGSSFPMGLCWNREPLCEA